jgi:hypothetical protein
MRVGLVIPCYIDVFYPEVGIATLELLEKLGIEVEYPFDQTCCGQPMANSGCESNARATEELFIRNFSPFEYIKNGSSGTRRSDINCNYVASRPEPLPRRRWVSRLWSIQPRCRYLEHYADTILEMICDATGFCALSSNNDFFEGLQSAERDTFHR